jgi:hypothetical protein
MPLQVAATPLAVSLAPGAIFLQTLHHDPIEVAAESVDLFLEPQPPEQANADFRLGGDGQSNGGSDRV